MKITEHNDHPYCHSVKIRVIVIWHNGLKIGLSRSSAVQIQQWCGNPKNLYKWTRLGSSQLSSATCKVQCRWRVGQLRNTAMVCVLRLRLVPEVFVERSSLGSNMLPIFVFQLYYLECFEWLGPWFLRMLVKMKPFCRVSSSQAFVALSYIWRFLVCVSFPEGFLWSLLVGVSLWEACYVVVFASLFSAVFVLFCSCFLWGRWL